MDCYRVKTTATIQKSQTSMHHRMLLIISGLLLMAMCARATAEPPALMLAWQDNMLTISGPRLPGKEMKIHYLEAYCRPDSHTTDWSRHTVIGHKTVLISLSQDRTRLKLRCTLKDGVVVDHAITAGADEVDFRLVAHNPTAKASEAHWAQPCVRVGPFTGVGDAKDSAAEETYLRKSFIFLDGSLARMPTKDWATEAPIRPARNGRRRACHPPTSTRDRSTPTPLATGSSAASTPTKA